MSNVAIIFAGGVGKRMGIDTPKQFLRFEGKEVIIHTLERFEECEEIDAISIACLDDYIAKCAELVVKYNISKAKWIVPGGQTGQGSIFNALNAAYYGGCRDGYAVISDGVRPLVTKELISECLQVAREKGGAIAAVKAVETAVYDEGGKIGQLLDREKIMLIKAPQVFPIKDFFEVHSRAAKIGDVNNIDSISLMTKYGYDKYGFVMSDYTNIKITTMQDFKMFSAYKRMQND